MKLSNRKKVLLDFGNQHPEIRLYSHLHDILGTVIFRHLVLLLDLSGHLETANLKIYSLLRALGTFNDPLSGLRQFLATESLLQMMKNTFHCTLKALFVLKLFKFLS